MIVSLFCFRGGITEEQNGDFYGDFHIKLKCKCLLIKHLHFKRVRLTGLEPARRKTPDPKSGASTNFATSAVCGCKGSVFP